MNDTRDDETTVMAPDGCLNIIINMNQVVSVNLEKQCNEIWRTSTCDLSIIYLDWLV